MPPDWVAEHLDVMEDILSRVVTGGVDPATYALGLEQLEDALGHRVVMAVAAPAHAAHQVMRLQEGLPVVAAEPAALVGMHGDCLPKLASPRGQQCIECQFPIHARQH